MKQSRKLRAFLALHPAEQIHHILQNDGAKSQDGRSSGCGLLTQTRVCNDWKAAISSYILSNDWS